MKITQDVLEVLDRALLDGPRLTLQGQLDRALYTKTAKAIEAAGGKWDRRVQAHVFGHDAADTIEPLLLTGLITVAKQEFGAFFTPAALAERLVDEAAVGEGMSVLEPSAGEGALVGPCLDRGAVVEAIEIRQEAADVLAQKFGPRLRIAVGDFLSMRPRTFLVDRVVMNPPFAGRADIRHITHAHTFVQPDGWLAAIASQSVMFRDDRMGRDFRDLVEIHGGRIEALPEDSFKASGTSVNTCIVLMRGPK